MPTVKAASQSRIPRQKPVQQTSPAKPPSKPQVDWSLVQYYDVLAASYGPRAVRIALEHVTGRQPSPPDGGRDVDVAQAKWMIERFGGGGWPAAGAVWLDRQDGFVAAPKHRPPSPQHAPTLVANLDQWQQVYAGDAVKIAAEAWLKGKTPTGQDVDSAQARWMVKYFDYLNNKPVVKSALKTWLAKRG